MYLFRHNFHFLILINDSNLFSYVLSDFLCSDFLNVVMYSFWHVIFYVSKTIATTQIKNPLLIWAKTEIKDGKSVTLIITNTARASECGCGGMNHARD